ncbi:caspase family protein [Nocardioides lijunqiniae]|uniref:caspase family protein n=1 Tax=Nocardioides lijunqiniae TaxID=2760832 RepID=UPI00187785C7
MSDRRALVVGVGHYDSWDPLPACLADADEMERVLETHADTSPNFDVTVLRSDAGRALSAEDLMFEFDLLLEKSAGFDLVFYFSGHGSVTKYGLQLALAHAEGDFDSGVNFDVLMHRASQETYESLTVILDCCFSGSASNIGLSDHLGLSIMRPNTTILASSQAGRPSHATQSFSHYTRALVEGFDGLAVDALGQVTPFELHRRAMIEMRNLGNSPPVLKSHNSDLLVLRQA